MENVPPRATVRSVARVLDILEALAEGETTLAGIAARAGLSGSTTHRLLATLVERGYSERAGPGRYRLGRRLHELATRAEAPLDRLRLLARQHLIELRNEFDETANLVLLDGLEIIYIDQVASTQAMRMFAEVGRRVPAYASAAGKALLAYGPSDVLVAQGLREPFPALTTATRTTLSALAVDLGAVRDRGYAIDHEEIEEGVICVAAPVLAGTVAIAALSISGPSFRMRRLDLDVVGTAVAHHAGTLSAQLSR